MPRCTRKGCQKEYEADEECIFHPGAPVFHEGLKSWSCCNDVNKPVTDFDDFMKIPGCMKTERHTSDAPTQAAKPEQAAPQATSTTQDGKEVYGTAAPKPDASKSQSQSQSTTAIAAAPTPEPVPVVEEEDELSIQVAPGKTCMRKGCGVPFVSDAENRLGDGPGTVCRYHPLPPFFREGSKGYLCCKRRVLEFDEFLKIEGCKTGRHLFATKAPDTPTLAECRIEHYQTLDKVFVSVYAKRTDKEKSTVTFEEDKVHLDLFFLDTKRFTRTLQLFGPVDPVASTFVVMGTKVDLNLKKKDNRSWAVLESKDAKAVGGFSLTFGVTGRTGTVGGKEKDLVLDAQNLKIS
ncbi:chord-domain-containing protein [Cylindrobasidium torrendii FP15055 ss-10]|uniref:Chord-domain-containing protein n=1 Tax=Cylindrobasidium torrendii FP15055 ss-10 TaxID=1314674 RepID=A0A0D7B2Q5_9AGAR|nr:chord-domain-containing protein [Cylindrobasidium torrendii FP15055 ss-10]